MILLAVEDVERDAPIRDLLTGEGWWVTTVGSKEEALRAAADHAPQLLILDRGMDDPASLLKVFSRARGGCGVLVLLDSLTEEEAGDSGDGVVARDQEADDLVARVRQSLDAPRSAQESSPVEEPPAGTEAQLTARDLFGDILVDLGEPEEPEEPEEPGEPGEPEEAEEAEEAEESAELGETDGPEEVVEDVPAASDGVVATEAEPTAPAPDGLGSVEVPVPPDRAAHDALAIAAEAVLEAQGDASSADTAPDDAASALEEASVPEGLESEADRAEALLSPLLTEEDADEGDSTTDLVEEVADLLESSRAGWPSTDEPESGEGLSIEEVLAVEESVTAEFEPEGQTVAVDEDEGATTEEPESVQSGEDLERVGPYELIELAEFGDLTERWLARRVGRGRKKVILERVRADLRNRADVRDAFVEGNSDAAGWDHENVLSVVDLGRDGDVDYVATEYHPGRSLAEVLDRVARMEARMPLGVSLLLIERIAAALEVLAESPTASRHGWLVPSSIWLGQNGEVLLREFGLGRLAASEDTPVRDWSEHRFSAPEKRSNRGDLRSDLYSLGAVLYEMVSGRPVHAAEDYEALVKAIRSEEITPAQEVDPTIPSEIDAWVMRLLRRNPQDRPQSVPEVMAKIDLALQALPARPASAELNAYVRQLFAARVPDRPAPVAAVAPDKAKVDAAGSDPTGETSGGRWTWWWLLFPLLALLSVFVGWKLFSNGGEAAGLTDRPDSGYEVAVAASRGAGPLYALIQ